jgi:hypothetical protein
VSLLESWNPSQNYIMNPFGLIFIYAFIVFELKLNITKEFYWLSFRSVYSTVRISVLLIYLLHFCYFPFKQPKKKKKPKLEINIELFCPHFVHFHLVVYFVWIDTKILQRALLTIFQIWVFNLISILLITFSDFTYFPIHTKKKHSERKLSHILSEILIRTIWRDLLQLNLVLILLILSQVKKRYALICSLSLKESKPFK